MSDPYVGEIRMFAANFAPAGWMLCQGQLLPISEWDMLFNLIGTTYGGDGQSTFQLPDLQGRIPVHTGNGYYQGATGGVETVTLTISQMPSHTHTFMATTSIAAQSSPINNILAQSSAADLYLEDIVTTSLDPNSISVEGGGLPHANVQPFQCINYIISMSGIYPSPF